MSKYLQKQDLQHSDSITLLIHWNRGGLIPAKIVDIDVK